ncbi:hypothetical protein WR25_04777 isoform AG [Diploscapter pachys]|uniref:Protein tincar n=3 Tax=Diploscapter pachys TaxID=2018661 RepID=A0A2A2L454_9BILA|nr:hypothetical protein WR25_04777 isoform A [Diploscapter pachys]PAV80946.1 hypothetical protein WR25_04777 isoform C [Diploscapter pachys]PAV80952.1 hypothetical protein WR25_04777 isoform I [Diploscapter pachys]PAV80972.1 hypothetical protein WR25_04777 isoform AC [Diploscapter pachys]PAV80973.1 hypothetical protein WR25_04777 isoform AD [Diploscapter pachys]
MGCIFRARLNHLVSIWYTLFVLALQVYLLYLGFERFKLYNEVKWPTGGYPRLWLTVYIALYAACIPLLLLFFSFGCFKSGNIPGDLERLADREERVIEVSRNRKGEKTGCIHRLKSLWQHSPPLPQQIHVLMAMCQLLAQQLMISQLYKNGFVNSGDFLSSELDFLYQRSKQLATNLPIGETRLQGFRLTSDELGGLPVSPNLLPILMHIRLFGIPLEFVNLFIALVAYSIAYPAVFWRVSKSYSLIFSLHLFIYSACVMWSYIAFSIMFRIQETNAHSMRPVGLGQYLVSWRRWYIYDPLVILGCFVGSFILMTINPMTVYAHGYNKYYATLLYNQAKSQARSSSMGQSQYGSRSNCNSNTRIQGKQFCCDGYGPHSLAITILVFICILKAPTIYAFMIFFQHEGKYLLLTHMVIDVVYLFSWIFLWLFLTAFRNFDFNVAHKAHQFYALQKGQAAGHIKGNENPSQLKNALIVMHKDHMFVTDEAAIKQSLLRQIQTGRMDHPDDTYMGYKTQVVGSPTARRIALEDASKPTPEMTRLIRDDHSQGALYHTITRNPQQQPMPSQQMYAHSMTMRGNSSPPDEGFASLRQGHNSNYMGMGTLQRSGPQIGSAGTLQRGHWPTQQEAYASIHKAKDQQIYQRRNSGDGQYGMVEGNYGNYATYSRIQQQPQVSRIPVAPNQSGAVVRQPGMGGYAPSSQQSSTMQRRPSGDNQPSSMSNIRQSPLMGERGINGINGQQSQGVNGFGSTREREQSPYQRSAVKLSSFNNGDSKNGYGSAQPASGWSASQRPTPEQNSGSQHSSWNGSNSQATVINTKPSLSTSSSNQEHCFTPTSTLTSHSQSSTCSDQNTPTPGSPSNNGAIINTSHLIYGTAKFNGGYGIINEDLYECRTLQKIQPTTNKQAIGSTSMRHTVKNTGRNNDDSANYSLASSNGSQDTQRQAADFATSIV